MTLLNEADKIYVGDAEASAVYAGSVKVWPPISEGPTAPSTHLNISYAPGMDRNDFSGEVGVRICFSKSMTFTWLGARRGTDNTGLHQVSVYEWIADTLVARGNVDFTGKAVGEYAWVKVPPFTVASGGYYGILKQTTAWDGQQWANTGGTTFKFSTQTVGAYRPVGGALAGGSPDQQYVGVDLGWDVASPPVTDGLKVWIDASRLDLADGAAVSPWPNLVAGGAHGYVVGGAVPPKLRTNARNGLSVVHVNALEGRFVWDNNTTGVTWPYTVIYVACKTDLRVSVARLVGAVYPPQNLLVGYYSSFDQAFVGYFIGTPRTPVANEWNMYTLSNDLNGYSHFWANGVELPGGGGGEQNWGGSLVLGGYDPTAAYDAQCPDADYGELLMYDRKLSDAERISVENYLRTKWGLS